MQIQTAWASGSATESLVSQIAHKLACKSTPSALIVFFNVNHCPVALREALQSHFDCPFMLASSCQGAFGNGYGEADAKADIVIMALVVEGGHISIGHSHVDEQAVEHSARQATLNALTASGVPNESPALIWCAMPPGNEESLLKGIAAVVGPHVPVFGGSVADNSVSGGWYCGDHQDGGTNTLTVAVMYPSGTLGMSYSSGYHPTEHSCVVTEVTNRTLQWLDGDSAAEVYNHLSGNIIEPFLQGGAILSCTTLAPLGRAIPSPAGTCEYLLSHPDSVTPEGGLSLFSRGGINTELVVMQGSIDSLVQRAEKVISNAISLLPENTTPAGVLLVYCAGCMFAVDEQIHQMQKLVSAQFPELPVCGMYTFGEQGRFLDGTNRHGNLMISAVAFTQ